jgi:hypothetical protein
VYFVTPSIEFDPHNSRGYSLDGLFNWKTMKQLKRYCLKRYLLTGLLMGICSVALAQSRLTTVSGTVFVDKNQNGKQDAQEKGLRQIPVSNGEDIVLTDPSGRFSLTANPGNSIFPILPSEYSVSNRIKNAAFVYLPPKDSVSRTRSISFPLIPQGVKTAFNVAVVGDVQVDNEQEIQYTNQTLIPDLMGRSDVDFHVFMGDLVNDKPALLPTIRELFSALPASSWMVCGNHDRWTKTDFPPDMPFNEQFGASTYAFNYGRVHFVVLNNVFPKGRAGYEPRLSEQQVRFLANDLKLVDTNRLVVLMMHIPLAETANQSDVLSLLLPHREVLVLSAHLHAVERFFLNASGKVIPEWGVGATCGAWWTGERDVNGIPSGLMSCGSPRNYFVLNVTDETFCMTYKGIGMDAADQMALWISGQDTLDASLAISEASLAVSDAPTGLAVVANLFAGSDSTDVRMRVDHLPAVSMVHTKMVSPNVSRVLATTKTGVYPTAFSRRAALRKSPSPHVWRATLPEGLTPGIHVVWITGKDGYGLDSVCGSRTFLVK